LVITVNKDLYIIPLNIIIDLKQIRRIYVNKKIAVVLVPILLSSILLSGCLGGDKHMNEASPSHNSAPVPIITAPTKTFFGEPIKFDASKSYDTDGRIESYSWIFEDDETAEGVAVTHTYQFNKDFDIEYPLIYSVVLAVVDDNKSCEYTTHEIMLYPKEYIFYLDSRKLTTEKPSSNHETIRVSFGKFNPLKELVYDSPDSIKILPCRWNATIYIDKPRLAILNRISLTLYNETGAKIAEADITFGLFDIWKEKTILIKGEIVKPEEIKSVKLVFYGFSIREKINIFYGGEKASQICFDFTI